MNKRIIITVFAAFTALAVNIVVMPQAAYAQNQVCADSSTCPGPDATCVEADSNNPTGTKQCRNFLCKNNTLRILDANGAPTGNNTLKAGQTLEITMNAEYGVNSFTAAFYNKSNPYPQNGTPKGILVPKSHLDKFNQTSIQLGTNYALNYSVNSTGTSYVMKVPYEFVNTPDLNTGANNAVATSVQINGYFGLRDPNRFSMPEAACVTAFTLDTSAAPTTAPANTSCPAQSSCTNQKCACSAGYNNCDNNWTNGCEVAGKCQAGGVCTDNAQCSSGVCKDHICQAGGATAVPPTGTQPTGTQPTAAQPTSAEPTKVPSGGSCENTSQCLNGYACMSGKCLPTLCDGQRQCPGGYSCKQGVCFPGTCDANNPCVNGYNCSNGMCLPSQCRADQPCPPGYACNDDGSCKKEDTAGKCTDDASCKANGQCISGSCFCKEGTYNCDRDWADGCESTAPCQGSGTAKILIRAKFNGIGVNIQPVDNAITVKVQLMNKYLTKPIEKEVTMTEYGKGDRNISLYQGSFDVNSIPFGSDYSVFLKGEQHLQKRICDQAPTEIVDGRYYCTDGEITIKEGENILDFTKIYQLGGDVPISNAQSGFIDSVDVVFIRSNFGSKDPGDLTVGDLNKDGIIDTQDYALALYALSFKYDEEITTNE